MLPLAVFVGKFHDLIIRGSISLSAHNSVANKCGKRRNNFIQNITIWPSKDKFLFDNVDNCNSQSMLGNIKFENSWLKSENKII